MTFSFQFIKIITRYGRIGYNLIVMRQSACLDFNPIMVDNYAVYFLALRPRPAPNVTSGLSVILTFRTRERGKMSIQMCILAQLFNAIVHNVR